MSADQPDTSRVLRPRVLLSGYFSEPTGYGTASRAYAHAFAEAGMDLTLESRSPLNESADPLIRSLLDRPLDPEFFISHAEPGVLQAGGRPLHQLIALTTFESETLPPPFVQALNRVREVWVPSAHNAQVFERQLSVPVFRLPHAVNLPPPALADPAEINQLCGLAPSDFVFLSVATWQERKNLAGAIEAFLRAFPDAPGIKLLLKTSFAFVPLQAALQQVRQRLARLNLPHDGSQALERVRIVDLRLNPAQMAALMHRADCYLSLHRGEGWCYPLFDAACAGTPLVATGYSGPMDYLDPASHALVRFAMRPVERGDDPASFPFSPGQLWAEPDLEHAAAQMLTVCQNAAQIRLQATATAARLRQEYSFAAVGARACQRLGCIGL